VVTAEKKGVVVQDDGLESIMVLGDVGISNSTRTLSESKVVTLILEDNA